MFIKKEKEQKQNRKEEKNNKGGGLETAEEKLARESRVMTNVPQADKSKRSRKILHLDDYRPTSGSRQSNAAVGRRAGGRRGF